MQPLPDDMKRRRCTLAELAETERVCEELRRLDEEEGREPRAYSAAALEAIFPAGKVEAVDVEPLTREVVAIREAK